MYKGQVVFLGVHGLDAADAAFACLDVLPKVIFSVADGGDDSHASDDYATLAHVYKLGVDSKVERTRFARGGKGKHGSERLETGAIWVSGLPHDSFALHSCRRLLADAARPGAVSYTHLDVYKRQT